MPLMRSSKKDKEKAGKTQSEAVILERSSLDGEVSLMFLCRSESSFYYVSFLPETDEGVILVVLGS